jgi:hypothetical protein
MRIEVPTFNTASQIVRDLLEKARNAPSMGEAAYFQRLARKASEQGR